MQRFNARLKLFSSLMPVVFLVFSIYSVPVYSQKPKLGLVLSGGGAKGIAHVGILKAMEKAGLRPDYIAGTSMGAIIGGLYSIGYSADQIESIIRSINWEEILSNNIPMNYISYEEKEYYNRFLIELPVESGRILLPMGLIEGQMLSEILNHYTWPAMEYKHFDELPIPFRCIATDVSTGQPIIFEKGSLAEALRASMAIPTAFSAVEIDSTIAVDGGVVDNFPADVLKQMGADIIIGMNVTLGFVHASEVTTMTGILLQMSMLSSNEKLPENIAMCDVYIQPDMSGYSNASFSKYDEIIKIGDEAAMKSMKQLDSLSALLGKFEISEGIKEFNFPVIIDEIEFSGNSLFNDNLISGKLGLTPGDTIYPHEIEEGVRTVYGINGFYKVEYRLRHADEHRMTLKIRMKEKPPVTMRTSFHFDNLFSAGIVLNFQFRDLLLKSSRTILAGDISSNPRFRFDHYKYIGSGKRKALNVRYDYFNEQLPVYNKGSKSDIQSNIENSLNVNFLTTQSLRSSYLVGATIEYKRFNSEFGNIFPNGIKYGDFNFVQLKAAFNRNTLNNQNYPTKGIESLAIFRAYIYNEYNVRYSDAFDSLVFTNMDDLFDQVYLTENEANERLKLNTPEYYGTFYVRALKFIHLSDQFQLNPFISGGLILANDSVNMIFDRFNIGGNQQVKITDTRVLGLNYAEYRLENFALAGFMFQNVYKNFYLKYGANYLVYHEYVPITEPQNVDFENMIKNQSVLGYGVELTYKSFIGPITLGASSNVDDGYLRLYFALGYSFNYSD